jgi:hypothetical protein
VSWRPSLLIPIPSTLSACDYPGLLRGGAECRVSYALRTLATSNALAVLCSTNSRAKRSTAAKFVYS